jgi:hypothetical protein
LSRAQPGRGSQPSAAHGMRYALHSKCKETRAAASRRDTPMGYLVDGRCTGIGLRWWRKLLRPCWPRSRLLPRGGTAGPTPPCRRSSSSAPSELLPQVYGWNPERGSEIPSVRDFRLRDRRSARRNGPDRRCRYQRRVPAVWVSAYSPYARSARSLEKTVLSRGRFPLVKPPQKRKGCQSPG